MDMNDNENKTFMKEGENANSKEGRRISRNSTVELRPNSIQNLLLRLLSAWLFASGIMAFTVSGESLLTVKYSSRVNVLVMIMVMALVFFVVTAVVIYLKSRYFDSGFLLISLLVYTIIVVAGYNNKTELLAGVLVFWAFVLYFTVKYRVKMFESLSISDSMLKVYIALGAAAFVAFVGGFGVFRYLTYSAPNYDFGLFSQMFYYMKETFMPLTTSERGTLLSHFAIHVSPIFYLLLPGYLIFPNPMYLQIMQAVILASGVIPLYLLCRHYQLSNKYTICIATAFLFFPAISGGCFYDIHENCFLLPLLLWFFYAAEKGKVPLFYLFGILVLMVKEDAFIYLFFVCVYFIITGKMRFHSSLMMAISIFYFGFALMLLYFQGYGAMTNRFSNFMTNKNGSLLEVVKNVLVNPALVIFESFEIEKILYIIMMLAPLGFLPVFCKKNQQLILIMPFVLINLMPDYNYQHSIYFQYNFGVIAIFFYLVVINLKRLKGRFKKFMALFIVAGTVAGFFCTSAGFSSYFVKYFDNQETINTINMYLDDIPSDASVISDTMFVARLSQRNEIYERNYTDVTDVDYYIYDMRNASQRDKKQEEIEQLINEGYVKVVDEENIIVILSAK